MTLLVAFYLQVLWNLILIVILCKQDTLPQLSRFVYMNAIAFFSPYDQKLVVEELVSLPQTCFFVKTANKQVSHAL